MSIQDLYRAAVIDHNRSPRQHFALANATVQARGLNALCGDDIQVYVRVEGEQILAASFTGEPSAITMASASMMCQCMGMKTRAEFGELYQRLRKLLTGEAAEPAALGELAAFEGVRHYPSRIKSVLLPWATAAAALRGQTLASTE